MTASDSKELIINSLKKALTNVEAFEPKPKSFVVTLGGRLDQFATLRDNYAAVDNSLIPTQFRSYDAGYLTRSTFTAPSGKNVAVNAMPSADWKAKRTAELTQLINETQNA